jgi:excisionase family DNA binding protein
MTDRLLTARAVAEKLEVTPATVLRWTRNGDLPAVRLPGGALRYSELKLGAWLEERATSRKGTRTPLREVTSIGSRTTTDAEA